jgi:ATP-dependent DNA helicase RecQ
MAPTLDSLLRTHFSFEHFRPGQEKAISYLLNGEHTLVVMPTGSGKSLIYQLVALEKPGLTLVISPLIALMKDQVDGLDRRRISATFINSAISTTEQNLRLQKLAAGKYRIVYLAPERLRSVPFLKAVHRQSIRLLAVDEAHCLSEWGHDFRPDYLHIADTRTYLGSPLTVALTATATPRVQDDIIRLLGLPDQTARVVTGFNRSNLALQVLYTSQPQEKLHALRELLADVKQGSVIIYTGTRRDAEDIAEFAREVAHIHAEHYHAGLDINERNRIQDAFITGKLSVVVATNAFGMGIDRPDVRLVIHYNLPGSVEAYYQEAGRAGRDGLPARAVLFYAADDRALQEWFIENSKTTPEDLSKVYNSIKIPKGCQAWMTCQELSRRSGIPEVKVRVALAELERAGALEHLGDEGVRMLLQCGPWDMPAIVAAIQRGKHHLAHRKQQLDKMVMYAESNACRRSILMTHFGDSGHAEAPLCCDNCAAIPILSLSTLVCASGNHPAKDTLQSQPKLSETQRSALAILDCVRRLPRKVGCQKLAQILQGSHAQDIQNFGYDKSTYYGRFKEKSQSSIEDMIHQLSGEGYLKVIGSKYPVLSLTPRGEKALQEKADIQLNLSDLALTKRKETPIDRILDLGESRSAEVVPELVEALENPNGNIRRLAASALKKIGDKRAVEPLMKLLSKENKPQVRQYAVKALGSLRDSRAKGLLQAIAIDPNEKDYTRAAARAALTKISSNRPSQSISPTRPIPKEAPGDILAYLSHPHPRPLYGPWHSGWALDFHSSFTGKIWNRSPVGELAYRLKYQNDLTTLSELLEHTATLLAAHPELAQVDAIIPVPPSTTRPNDPVSAFVGSLAKRFNLKVLPAVLKTRQTAPQKQFHTIAQKQANVAGAFTLQKPVRNLCLLLVDDLFDSGATLKEITRLLHKAGASSVYVLTLTRTIHSDA